MKWKMMKTLAFLMVIVMACTPSNGWETLEEITIRGTWNHEDPLRLTLKGGKEEEEDLYFTVTHTPDFGYENIYLKYVIRQSGNILKENVASILFMDDQGSWIGENKGGNYAVTKKIGSFDMTKPLSIEVQQYGRKEDLEGVVAIGVGVR